MTAQQAGAWAWSVSQASTLTVTCPLPPGLADGDLVVLVVRHQGSGADPLTLPAGSPWVPLVNVAGATNQRAMAIMALPLPSAAAAPASVTLTRSTTAGRYVAHTFRVVGADLAAFNGGGSAAYVTAAPTYTVSAWSAADAPGLAVYAAAHDTVAGSPAIAGPATWAGGPSHLATTGSGGDSTATSTTWLSTALLRVADTAVPAGSATWNRGGGAGAGVGAVILDAPEPEPEPGLGARPAVSGREVTAPSSAEWLDASAVDTTTAPPSYTLTAAGAELRLPLEYLTPGRPYTVQLAASAVPAAGAAHVTLMLEGVARRLLPGVPAWLEWTTEAARPLVLEVLTVSTLTVDALHLVATAEPAQLERRALPADELSLEVLVPRPGADAFLLDTSRLDRAALDAATPWPGTFVLDTSRLDEGYLHVLELTEWWRPILGPARALSIRRGARTDGLVPVADAGTLVAEIPNALDPRELGVRRGTPVRAYHWPTRRPLFTGEILRAAVTPQRPGARLRYLATLEATDAVAQLAESTRYGALVGPGLTESWTARIERLMGSAPELSWRIVTALAPAAPSMANTVHETSLAEHLDIATASARGCWWVGADGVVRLCAGRPAGQPAALFTDEASTDPAAWAYVDAAAGWDTAAFVSVVELRNLGAAYTAADGSWAADDQTVSVANATLLASYGRRRGAATVNVAAGEAESIAAALARGQGAAALVTRVRVDALPAMARAAALELFTPVRAQLRGELREALAAEIVHTITPRRWHTEIGLLERTPA
jgi:hypothetical protein